MTENDEDRAPPSWTKSSKPPSPDVKDWVVAEAEGLRWLLVNITNDVGEVAAFCDDTNIGFRMRTLPKAAVAALLGVELPKSETETEEEKGPSQ